MYPAAPPDLFANQPLVLFGRKQDNIAGKLTISGVSAGAEDYENVFDIDFESATANPAVAQLWGRDRIKDLMNQMFGYETKTGVEEVTETALTYQLLSQYTAFIAVSDDERVNPQQDSISMQVPVEMPEAVDFMQMEMHRGITAAGGMMFCAENDGSTDWCENKSAQREQGISITPSKHYLEIVQVTGLDETAISNLQQYLEKLFLGRALQGEIVFEFSIRNNRVRRIVLDKQNSTEISTGLIRQLIEFIRAWKPSQKTAKKVVLILGDR